MDEVSEHSYTLSISNRLYYYVTKTHKANYTIMVMMVVIMIVVFVLLLLL